MSDTIEDFADFFHPDKKEIKFMPLTTIGRALKLIDAELKNITIEINTKKDIWLYTYENEYLQVLLTILHNAIENFTAHQITDPNIHFTLTSSKEKVSLFIQDNGGGIQTKKLKTIFDPYFTTNYTGKNSGLGLYMAKILVEESMQGTLNVTNKDGGACFEISLPKGEMNDR